MTLINWWFCSSPEDLLKISKTQNITRSLSGPSTIIKWVKLRLISKSQDKQKCLNVTLGVYLAALLSLGQKKSIWHRGAFPSACQLSSSQNYPAVQSHRDCCWALKTVQITQLQSLTIHSALLKASSWQEMILIRACRDSSGDTTAWSNIDRQFNQYILRQ